MKPGNLARDILVAAVLLLLSAAGLGGAYVLFERHAAGAPAAKPMKAAEVSLPKIPTVRLAEGPLAIRFARRGTLEPSTRISVLAETTARVLKRHVDVGTRVQPGDVLLELDDTLLKIRLDEAQARLKLAETRLEEAETQRKAAEKSDDADVKREAALRRDAAQSAVQVAKTQVAEAEAAYQARQVRSPIGGVVSQCWVAEGEFAAATRPAVDVIATNPITAIVSLTAREAASLRGEVQCQIDCHEVELVKMAAKLVYVSPAADPRTKRFSARVDVENPRGRLHPGMQVDVTFGATVRQSAIVLPRRAVTFRDDRSVCFRIEKDSKGYAAKKITDLQLEPIPGRPELLRVLGGLRAGDEVAVDDLMLLEDGTRVQPDSRQGPSP